MMVKRLLDACGAMALVIGAGAAGAIIVWVLALLIWWLSRCEWPASTVALLMALSAGFHVVVMVSIMSKEEAP